MSSVAERGERRGRGRGYWLLLWGGLGACSPPAEPAHEPAPLPEPARPPTPTEGPTSAPPPTPHGVSTAPAPTPEPFGAAPYPPPSFAPMHERTAQPGDGEWKPIAHGLTGAAPALHRAEIHPDKLKKHVFVTFIAFDRKRVSLGLEAGVQEPESKAVPAEKRTGLVPQALQSRLLAVFNGGFKAQHGGYGMMLRGDEYVPPKDDACTVALYPDGGLRIRSWPVLAPEAPKMDAWRQAPPCLVEQGVVNPALASEHVTRKWGAAQGGDREIRRSALALDASGRTLVYAFGDWITASQLADALAAAGLHDATELDINWSYTRFYFVEHASDGPRLSETIIPKGTVNPARYLTKFDHRDFFYAYLRDGG